jgi:Tol biopolymer transport system component
MTSDRWERIKAILNDALDLPAAERASFVRESAEDDPELLAELLRLVAENDRDTEMLSHPALVGIGTLDGRDGPRYHLDTVLANRFRIVRFIARGGMGEVYEAEDLDLGGRVALKAIRRRIAPDDDLLALFKREIQLARQVTHPNVCRIFDLVHDQDTETGQATMLLSMELLEGQTLSDHLEQHGPFAFRNALPLIEEISAGLQAVHDVGIIHGDLKPANVMLASQPGEPRPRAVVMDFGLASPAAQDSPDTSLIRGRTPEYSAPEQAQGAPLTTATDVYCLALVVGEMLGVPRQARLKPDAERMPSRWARVLRRCLDNDPARRYPRPAEMARLLRKSADFRRRTAARAGVALLIAAVGVSAGVYWRGRTEITGTASRLLYEEGEILSIRCVSPDGRFVAMTSWDTGDLVLRDVSSGRVRRVTHDVAKPGTGYHGVTAARFSPDSRRIVYEWATSRTSGELRLIAADGTGEQTFYRSEDALAAPLDWSSDGKQIAATLWQRDNTQRLALISAADGTVQLAPVAEGAVGGKAIFSGDGKTLVYDLRKGRKREIHAISMSGVESTLIDNPGSNWIVGWTPDRKRLIFASDRLGPQSIWDVSLSDQRVTDEPRELVSDAAGWETFGVAQTGSLFYRHESNRSDVYTAVLDLAAGRTVSPPRLVMDRLIGSYRFPNWSEDGRRLVFGSGFSKLVVYEPGSGEKHDAPVNLDFARPQWLAHGTSVVAPGRDKGGRAGLFRIDPLTGAATMLIPEKELESALEGTWSTDGKIHFNRYVDHRRGIFRLNTETGDRRVLYVPPPGVDVATENLTLSPDGRTLAFHARNDAEKTSTLMLIPEGGGEARPLLTVRQPEAFLIWAFTWTPDSRQVLVSRTRNNRVSEIWLVPVDGSSPRKIDFPAMRVTCLRLNADGKTIAFQTDTSKSEIWMLQNFLSDLR